MKLNKLTINCTKAAISWLVERVLTPKRISKSVLIIHHTTELKNGIKFLEFNWTKSCRGKLTLTIFR